MHIYFENNILKIYISASNFYRVVNFFVKLSLIIVISHRNVISFLQIKDMFKTAEIRNVFLVHTLFSSLSVISEFSPTYSSERIP